MIFVILTCVLIGYIYEDGDSLIINDDSLVICGNHQYNIKVHVANNGKLKVRPWSGATDSTGWLFLNAPLILIQDSSSINGSKSGYHGGDSTHANGYGPGHGEVGGISGGGGGGAGYGGNGGDGGDVDPGAGGNAYGNSSDTLIDMGSGGGAGYYLSAVDGFGGDGGAKAYVRAQKIIIDSSYIEINGEEGYEGTIGLEAGGGGSGGGIMLWADSNMIYNCTINANGGAGGSSSFGGGGGAGGGRVKIFYSSYLDTSGLVLSAQGGAGGNGGFGNGEPGMPGTIYIGPVMGITEIVSKPNIIRFKIQSNPVREGITITIEDPPILLRLYDVSGQIAKTFRLKNNTEFIHLDDLRQGVYFVKSNGENTTVGKIILLK